jgi:hypothetical protein
MANRSKKMTNQQKFEQFLKDKGFIVSPNYAVLSLVPHYYKTDADSHALEAIKAFDVWRERASVILAEHGL